MHRGSDVPKNEIGVMITVNANTRIAEVLREQPAALEAIIAISPRFERLRNPLLRKIMAGRTSIAMASKLGGCEVGEFLNRLGALGFVIDREAVQTGDSGAASTLGPAMPAFLRDIGPYRVKELDVRPIIAGGKDPLSHILAAIGNLGQGTVLKIVNSFEPTPLVLLLGKKGFESWTDFIQADVVHTYFYRRAERSPVNLAHPPALDEWDGAMERFAGKQVVADVRRLEMPLPMLTILDKLKDLPAEHALFVHHKRIPVFLLPELKERGFEYCIREIREGEVDILIFKKITT